MNKIGFTQTPKAMSTLKKQKRIDTLSTSYKCKSISKKKLSYDAKEYSSAVSLMKTTEINEMDKYKKQTVTCNKNKSKGKKYTY